MENLMNVFSELKVYAEKYTVISVRKFNDNEKRLVEKVEVIPSNYGKSACFFMKGGGTTYIPLDENSSYAIGDILNLENLELVLLGRGGKDLINRIR